MACPGAADQPEVIWRLELNKTDQPVNNGGAAPVPTPALSLPPSFLEPHLFCRLTHCRGRLAAIPAVQDIAIPLVAFVHFSPRMTPTSD